MNTKQYPNVIEIYDNLNSFVSTLGKGEVKDFYKDRFLSHRLKSADSRKNFFRSESYEEAVKLMLKGDLESAKLINETEKAQDIKGNGQKPQSEIYNSVQGFIPNMGRVLCGHPQNMINIRRNVIKNTKVVNIIYNLSTDYRVTNIDIAKQGAHLLAVVKELEGKGYQCNVFVMLLASYSSSNNKGIFAVKIKDAGKPLNVTRLAFPLVNSDFLRRICFCWIEKHELYDKVYGIPYTSYWKNVQKEIKALTSKFNGFFYCDYYSLKKSENVWDELQKVVI